MPRRIESPSSINTLKKCPRKYYYSYIEKIKGLPNIHQVRGNIVHSVLEKFFDLDVSNLDMNNFEPELVHNVQKLMMQEWSAAEEKLKTLDLDSVKRRFYFEESTLMLLNWLAQFSHKVKGIGGNFPEVFKSLTPEREKELVAPQLFVKGIIDAIETHGNETRIMDYKTSKSFNEKDHKLQLAIYSLLYLENFGKMPDKVGIYFLKDRPKFIMVDDSLIQHARKEIEWMHAQTQGDIIEDYPRKPGPLCKWSTGQCEYFDICKPFQSKEYLDGSQRRN